MTLESLLARVPEYAKDLRLNAGTVLRQAELTAPQSWGTAIACAVACRNPELLEAVVSDAREQLSQTVIEAAKSAAAVMGMNNIFYRFKHLSGNEKYSTMPARLRMQVIRTHGADAVDFELWCLAVSAVNGCGACVASHENVLKEKGVTEETMLAAVRIASVLHGLASVLEDPASRSQAAV